jgi:hypothetical protein
MKITHNSNNAWQEEASILRLDEQLYPWIEAVVKDEIKKAITLSTK